MNTEKSWFKDSGVSLREMTKKLREAFDRELPAIQEQSEDYEDEMEATFQKESEVVDLFEFPDEFYKTMFPNKTAEEEHKSSEEDLY